MNDFYRFIGTAFNLDNFALSFIFIHIKSRYEFNSKLQYSLKKSSYSYLLFYKNLNENKSKFSKLKFVPIKPKIIVDKYQD